MIIGLHGESRAGKDTVAQILQDKHDFEWRSFAANLREILLRIDPFLCGGGESKWCLRYSDALLDYGLDGVKDLFPEAVEYMISLGQSVRDIIGEDSWVTPVLHDLIDSSMDVVISDVRQLNEAQGILHMGGEIWKITRPGTVARAMDHYLDDWDFHAEIDNSGNLEDLEAVVSGTLRYRIKTHYA